MEMSRSIKGERKKGRFKERRQQKRLPDSRRIKERPKEILVSGLACHVFHKRFERKKLAMTRFAFNCPTKQPFASTAPDWARILTETTELQPGFKLLRKVDFLTSAAARRAQYTFHGIVAGPDNSPNSERIPKKLEHTEFGFKQHAGINNYCRKFSKMGLTFSFFFQAEYEG